jgi:hypothetical protein
MTRLSNHELHRAAEPLQHHEHEQPDTSSPLRVLFTTTAATGHFQPLVPFARALTAAGHTVMFATTPDFVATIEASGFPCSAVGVPTSPKAVMDATGIDLSRLSPSRSKVVSCGKGINIENGLPKPCRRCGCELTRRRRASHDS